MRLYLLDKTVLKVSGNAEKFLNGLTTNAVDRPRSAFVNMHGRIIATFDQVRAEDDVFFLVIEPSAFEPLIQHVGKFLMLNKTALEKSDLKAYFDLDGSHALAAGEYAIPQRAGKIVITSKNLNSNVSGQEFTLFRLKNNLPQFGVDYLKDEFLLNVDEHEFVSYTKGCFLGQEPIAKVHNRSKPTRKLVVRADDDLTPEEKGKMTSKARDPQSGKTLGFVFVSNREG